MERVLLATKTCPNCRMAAKKMDDMGVAYVEKFAEDPDGRQLAIDNNVQAVPVLFVTDGGNTQKFSNLSEILGYLKTL
jgi:glutaredoxin